MRVQVLGANFVAGSLGGALAAAVTTPLDVVKTRTQLGDGARHMVRARDGAPFDDTSCHKSPLYCCPSAATPDQELCSVECCSICTTGLRATLACLRSITSRL